MKIGRFSYLKIIYYLKSSLCIIIGTLLGLISYKLCLDLNLAIFGWNIGVVVAPMVAGYAETYFARKYLHETTGAISALILFIVTVIYGFIITNPTLGPNLLTLGISGVILQAAFPTFINCFLIVAGISLLSHFLIGFKKLKYYYYKLYNKIYPLLTGKESNKTIELEKRDYRVKVKPIDINNLGVLFSSTNKISNQKIKEYKGIFEATNFLRYNEKDIITLDSYEDSQKLFIEDLEMIKNQTFKKLASKLQDNGCNGVLEINVQYDTIKKDKIALIIQISINGTGIVLEDV